MFFCVLPLLVFAFYHLFNRFGLARIRTKLFTKIWHLKDMGYSLLVSGLLCQWLAFALERFVFLMIAQARLMRFATLLG